MYIMLQFTHITTWRTSKLCVTTRVHCHRNKLWNVTPLTTAKIRTPEKYEFLGYSVLYSVLSLSLSLSVCVSFWLCFCFSIN